MILHVATFTWREGTSQESVVGLTEDLAAMAAEIPEIRHYRCGSNLHLRPGGADYVVLAVVEDEAALAAYLDHPSHAAVVKRWFEGMTLQRHAVQIAIDDDGSWIESADVQPSS